ncbi:hypothetical protein [Mesorhizobium sp. A623]
MQEAIAQLFSGCITPNIFRPNVRNLAERDLDFIRPYLAGERAWLKRQKRRDKPVVCFGFNVDFQGNVSPPIGVEQIRYESVRGRMQALKA